MKLNKLAAATGLFLSLAIAAPTVALARHGADDPVGHVRGGHGADDNDRRGARRQRRRRQDRRSSRRPRRPRRRRRPRPRLIDRLPRSVLPSERKGPRQRGPYAFEAVVDRRELGEHVPLAQHVDRIDELVDGADERQRLQPRVGHALETRVDEAGGAENAERSRVEQADGRIHGAREPCCVVLRGQRFHDR